MVTMSTVSPKVRLGDLTESQQETVVDELSSIFCKKKVKYLSVSGWGHHHKDIHMCTFCLSG